MNFSRFMVIDVLLFLPDVVVYDWRRLVKGTAPLFRIAKNISLNHGFESSLPKGTYELKVGQDCACA